MLQGEETLKLQGFIKKKFPELNSEDLEKISHQLMELGTFLVRLHVQRSGLPKPSDDKPP